MLSPPSALLVIPLYVTPIATSSFPLYLPVTAASQTLSIQHLDPVLKPLWVIRILLLLSTPRHLPVVLRQREDRLWAVFGSSVSSQASGEQDMIRLLKQRYTDEVIT